FHCAVLLRALPSFPTRRSSDLFLRQGCQLQRRTPTGVRRLLTSLSKAAIAPASSRDATSRSRIAASADPCVAPSRRWKSRSCVRSEEHTSELQSRENLVCRLLL